jgi:hypothetical protein
MSKRIDNHKLDQPTTSHSFIGAEGSKQDLLSATNPRNKRRVPPPMATVNITSAGPSNMAEQDMSSSQMQPPAKKSRTNTPWTAAEEQRLKSMREAGNSWADIAKVDSKAHKKVYRLRSRDLDTDNLLIDVP